jgi:hypothetical protein
LILNCGVGVRTGFNRLVTKGSGGRVFVKAVLSVSSKHSFRKIDVSFCRCKEEMFLLNEDHYKGIASICGKMDIRSF